MPTSPPILLLLLPLSSTQLSWLLESSANRIVGDDIGIPPMMEKRAIDDDVRPIIIDEYDDVRKEEGNENDDDGDADADDDNDMEDGFKRIVVDAATKAVFAK